MEVWDHTIENPKMEISIIQPELNLIMKPCCSVYIVFQKDYDKIPIMGILPRNINSVDLAPSSSEDFSKYFLKEFIMFRRDFLNDLEARKNDFLQIQFHLKMENQLGVRFFFKGVSKKLRSKWYLLGIPSCRTLVIVDNIKGFMVFDEIAFAGYSSTKLLRTRKHFECAICLEQYLAHKMIVLACGHLLCKSDAEKITSSNCPICQKMKEPQNNIKLRDGFCPIDHCVMDQTLFLLLPCCCTIAHELEMLENEQCPFSTCRQKVKNKTRSLSLSQVSSTWWMHPGVGTVQRQLRDDWDNREYVQIIADNIKSISNFLSSFELSCRSKISTLSDKLSLLERKVEFLEAKVTRGAGVARTVAPVQSVTKEQARHSVLQVYKELQRLTPKFWWDFGLQDMPLGVFRSVLKQQFTKNAHLTDIRVVDRLVGETKQHIYSIRYAFYNTDHVRNYLFRENVEAKPKDFLSKFLRGKE